MSYRALARSAPLPFFPVGLLARLPYAITPIGSLLLLRDATGSHSFAGLAAGAQSIAIALSGFAAGWLVARFGARRLGMVLAVSNALAATLRTAFVHVSAVDELSFVVGPAVAGLFATVRPGDGPVLGMALLLLSSSLPFAAMYANGAVEREAEPVRSPLRGMAPRSFRLDTRQLVFSVTLVFGMAFLALSPWPVLGILVAGCAIAPYMITLYALTDALAPPARLPVAMAVLGAGGPVGTAVGQAVAGVLVDGPGIAAAWWAPVGCAATGLAVALVRRAGLGRRSGCRTGRGA